ncbi:uncharacterized protein V1510DRAFT_412437 [Dipodascopsis tothii]|uniref:uncharacterized protein n=1 Tax=Dipodascopsis tothii TaxID=44089 RepID=UPI0034CFA301
MTRYIIVHLGQRAGGRRAAGGTECHRPPLLAQVRPRRLGGLPPGRRGRRQLGRGLPRCRAFGHGQADRAGGVADGDEDRRQEEQHQRERERDGPCELHSPRSDSDARLAPTARRPSGGRCEFIAAAPTGPLQRPAKPCRAHARGRCTRLHGWPAARQQPDRRLRPVWSPQRPTSTARSGRCRALAGETRPDAPGRTTNLNTPLEQGAGS